MDGLWPHTAKTTTPAEHGYNKDGGYIYHHCANLTITADPAKPADKHWPAVRQLLSGAKMILRVPDRSVTVAAQNEVLCYQQRLPSHARKQVVLWVGLGIFAPESS